MFAYFIRLIVALCAYIVFPNDLQAQQGSEIGIISNDIDKVELDMNLENNVPLKTPNTSLMKVRGHLKTTDLAFIFS